MDEESAGSCACCARPWRLLDTLIPTYARAHRLGARKAESVCRECIPHQGSSFQADSAHRALWPDLLHAVEAAHRAEVERLNAEIHAAEDATAAAQHELAARPVKEVDKYVDQDDLHTAQSEAERAFRSRDRAWGALCEVRLQHREGDGGRCRCGRRWEECPTAQTLRAMPQLRGWERAQARRVVERLPHALPPSHPAVLDPNAAQRLATSPDLYEEDYE